MSDMLEKNSIDSAPDMPGLLVSVRDEKEALIAVECDVDVIDIKDPANGPLGAASLETVKLISEVVPANATLSAALGESIELDPNAFQFKHAFWRRCSFVKIGLANLQNTDWCSRLNAQFDLLPSSCKRVLVCYADWEQANAPSPQQLIGSADGIKADVVLFDTYVKDGSTLFDHLSVAVLKELLDSARARQLLAVIAGGLSLAEFPDAVSIRPDFIAVRGAACSGTRSDSISRDAILNLKRALKASFDLVN